MRRKFKRCMAVMLAVSTMVASVPVDYAFAEEAGTEVEYTTEAITEGSSEGFSEDSSKTVIDLSDVTAVNETVTLNSSESIGSTETTPVSEESHEDEDNGGNPGKETEGSETGSSETGSSETGSSETGSSETGSSEETDDSEEVEKESNSQGETSTEGSDVVESESNAPESEETQEDKSSEVDESESSEEDKKSESEVTPDSEDVPEEDADAEESEKVTSTLEISVNNGGKVIIKDSDGNVIKEVTAVDTAVEPVRIDREEGTVVTLEVVTESEAYNVAMYRLMTDTGEVLQNTEYEEGMLSAKETFVFGSEKRCLMVSFTEVKTEEVPEVAPIQFVFSEGCEKIEVTCNGSSAEMPAMVSDEPLQAYFPTGTDIEMKLVAKEGYEVSYIELSTGDKSDTGEIKFQLSSAEGVVVTTLCEKVDEGTAKKIKSVGPGTTYVFEEGKDGDAVATLKDGDVFEVKDASAVYILEMQPNDLSIPYTITRYEDGKQIDQENNLWVQLNPGEGVSSYIGDAVFNESEVSEKYVCEYKSIESLNGIPTASGDNTEKTDPDFKNLVRTSGADMANPKVGDVFVAKCKVTSHMYAFNYFASQAPLKVTITGGTDYKDMWNWFGGKTFKLAKCASTTSECCPYYGTPGKLYFIVTKVTKSGVNTKVSGKLFFQNDYRNSLSQGYYWQNAHGTDSYNIYKVRIKKAVYELDGNTTVTGIDYEQVYDKLAVFEIWDKDKSKKIETVTTDEKGVGYAEKLEPSTTYYMKEIKAPEGAQRANGWWKMRVDENGNPSSITYQGTTPGVGKYTQIEDVSTKGFRADNRYYSYKIKILKENGDGEWDDSLKGAKFEVHTSSIPSDSTLVEEIEITGEETVSSKKYPYGNTYYLFETKAPDGYKANNGYKKIRLDKEFFEGKSAMVDYYFTAEVPNTSDVTLIVNMDKGSDIPDKWSVLNTYNLVGAEYDVYSEESCTSSSYLGSLVTDGNGKGECSIPYSSKIGDYIWLKEDKAPIYGGFAKDPTAIKVNVTTVDNTKKEANATHIEEKKYVDFNVYKKLTRDSSMVGVADAQFTISVQGVAQGPLAGISVYSWTFKTDSSGKLMTNPAGLISGPADALLLEGGEYYFPCGYYYISEVKAPDNCIKSEDVYFYDCSETIPENVKVYSPGDIVFYNEPNTGYLKIKKTNSNPTVTEGNSMYGSIGDAQFTVYSDKNCTNELGKIDINNDGTSTVLEVPSGTVYVKETTFPKGFERNSTVITATITKDQTTEVSSSNKPLVGVLDISLVAKQNDCATTRSLEGANFQVNFYGSDKAEGTPLRSWVLKTNSSGMAYIRSSSLVSGDDLYGEKILPLGTIEVKEIKAPEGYVINSTDVKYYTLTQNDTYGNVEMPEVTPINIVDIAEYGGVKIKKVDNDTGSVQGDATLEGATYAIIVNDDDTLTRYTDRGTDVSFAKGEEIYRISTNEGGIAQTPVVEDIDGTHQLLQSGKYIIKEVDPSTGYLLPDWSLEFEITENGQVVDLTGNTCKEPIIRGGVSIAKWDIELNVENATQGDATLKGAEFTIYNKSKESVLVDTDGDGEVETYEPGDEIIVLVTDKEGKVSTKGDFLPYGTYEITETKSPEGYTYFGENLTRTVQIREDGKIYPFTDKTTATKNRVIRGDIEILKFKGDLSTEEPDDRVTSLSGIQFEISLKSSGEVVTTLTTDSRGYATTESADYPYGRLPYGLYVVHEVEESIPEGITPVDDFEVFIGRTGSVIGTIDSDATVFGDNNEYVDGNVYKGYYLNDRQSEMPIRVVKVSAESNEVIPLEGFTFQILDKNKDVVEFHLRYPHNQVVTEFTTDETGEAVLPEKLPYGTYYVHELEAPYGCILSKDLEFKVTSWSSWDNILEVRFPDDFAKGKVVITKYDKNTNTVLEGATFDIYANEDIITPDKVLRHSKGDYIETVTIGANGTGTSSELYLGKYYFVETYAPNGFLLEENKTEFELVYEDDETPIVYEYRDVYDKPIRFELYKYDIDGEELEDVTFKIEKVEDIEYTVTETSTDTPNPDTISGGTFVTDENGLITKDYWLPGIYSVTETATLPGYVLDDTVRYFKVEANGTISEVYNTEEGKEESEGLDADWYSNTVDPTGNVNKLTLSWKNDYTKWDFSKVDVTGDTELVGAEMEIYNSDNELVYSWTSDGELHRINKIPLGDYTLVEKTAPKGYVIASAVPFTVINTGVVQKATMIDKIVEAYKVDESGNGVVGATMVVYKQDDADSSGVFIDEVDRWVTDGTAHRIENLVVGKTYQLVEEKSPEGWVLSTPVTFTVYDDFKDQEVAMTDIRVKAHKYDETLETYVEGAKLQVIDSADNVVDEWVTTDEFHYISGLVAGKSYTLVEVAAPEGFVLANPVNFTVEDNGKDQEVVMVNKKVLVSKVDTEVKELAGAELEVRDSEGNVIDKWVSDGTPHAIIGLVVGETYTLVETKAPEGYAIATPIEFTVADNAKNDTIDLINKQVFVTKTDVTGEKEIEGATLIVYDKEGNEVDKWVSGSEAHPISNIVVGETYVLHEELAPEGYVIASDIEFTVMDDFKVQQVVMKDKQVFVTKKSVTGEDELPGAELYVVEKETGKEVDSWTSGTEAHAVSGLEVGKNYTLIEKTAPMGYVIATEVDFYVADDFTIQTVEMLDKQVFMHKHDVTGEKEIPGAIIVVTDKETGDVVDRWTSGEEPHAISGLEVTKTYILHEELAPEGYVIASDVEFTVLDDFKVQTVEMKDKQVFVSKKDVTGDNELPGAKLTVIDKETGEKVDEWISTEEEHPVSGIEVKKTYILIEETAPEGFVVAEQIEFTVEDDFTIQHVEMRDKQVFVSKQDITTGEEIGGAHLQVVDKDGNIIDEWVSEEGVQHPISGLVVGETYTLIETLAPDGYVTAEDIEFTVLDDFQIQEVVMLDDYTKVEISKQDATTGKELPGAKLVLYDEDGEIVDEWTSGDEPHYIEYLPVGKYTLHEDLAPVGYEIANDVEFEVEDTGEVQQVVMKDEPTPVVKKIAQTGENMIIFVSAGIAVLIALIGLFLVLKKRKRNA